LAVGAASAFDDDVEGGEFVGGEGCEGGGSAEEVGSGGVIDGGDDVAGFESGFSGGAIGLDVTDEEALVGGEAELLGEGGIHFLDGGAGALLDELIQGCELDGGGSGGVVVLDFEFDAVVFVGLGEEEHGVDEGAWRDVLDGGDGIAGLEVRFFGGAGAVDIRESEGEGSGLKVGTEPVGVFDFGGEDFGEGFTDLADGDGEADSLAFALDGDIEADELAIEVDEGAAAAAGVDGGVGLEPVFDGEGLVIEGGSAVFGAEDTAADGAAEAEGVTEGEDGFTEEEVVVGSELDGGELFFVRGDEAEEGDVASGGADDGFGFELAAIGELDPDFGGALDDVEVGEDVAFFVDDDAGAEAEAGATGAVAVVEAVEFAEELGEGVAVFDDFFRGDIDDGGHDVFDGLDDVVTSGGGGGGGIGGGGEREEECGGEDCGGLEAQGLDGSTHGLTFEVVVEKSNGQGWFRFPRQRMPHGVRLPWSLLIYGRLGMGFRASI
jgi:hypothetical protein